MNDAALRGMREAHRNLTPDPHGYDEVRAAHPEIFGGTPEEKLVRAARKLRELSASAGARARGCYDGDPSGGDVQYHTGREAAFRHAANLLEELRAE